MSDHLAGRVVMITGAAGGFGRIVAERCAALGARVLCLDVDEAGVEVVAEGIRAAGGEALARTADVRALGDLQAAVAAAVEAFGAVDVLVNNAGIMPLGFYSDHAAGAAAWERCIDINIKGVLNGIMAVHDQMLAQGRGHVVNLSSIYSNFPVAGAAVYGASKAAVNVLSEALRVESQGRIKVTVVRPTGVPGTNLSSGIVNDQAIVGILGQNAASYGQQMQGIAAGTAPAQWLDADHIEYAMLAPEHLAEQIVYAINQPWGVVIGDITVRAAGDGYIL